MHYRDIYGAIENCNSLLTMPGVDKERIEAKRKNLQEQLGEITREESSIFKRAEERQNAKIVHTVPVFAQDEVCRCFNCQKIIFSGIYCAGCRADGHDFAR